MGASDEGRRCGKLEQLIEAILKWLKQAGFAAVRRLPEGVFPAYCESWFPDEHIIDYMNLPYDDREKFLPFCVWYDEEPIMLITEKEEDLT